MNRTRLFLLFLFVTLSACGGGGGGDSGSGGSGSSSTLTVSVSSIDLTANRNDSLPPTQSFTVRWTGANVAGFVIGVPPGQTVPTWLDISTAGTNSPVTVTVGVNSTNLDVGTSSVTLRVVTGDANANPIRTVDIPLTYTVTDDFRASETALQTDRILGSTRFGAFQFDLLGENISWTGSTDQPWAILSPTSGTTPLSVQVEIQSGMLPAGTSTATATFTNDADAQDTVDVVFTIDVLPPTVVLDSNPLNDPTLTFSGTNGGNIFDQSINIELDNGQPTSWVIAPSEPWIVPAPIVPSGQARESLTVDIDPSAANLASGDYTGEIDVSTTYRGITVSNTIPVVLNLTPPVPNLLQSNFVFQGALPTDFVGQDLEFFPNVLPGFAWQFDFTYDNGSDWLTATPMSGVSDNNTLLSTSIRPDTAGLTEDRYTGSVDFTLFVNGDVVTDSVSVEVNLEPNRLAVPDNGVALMTSPGLSKLSHTVTVTDNRKIPTPWTAASDQPWLSVTPSGTTDGDLVLTADPTGLAAESIYYATVTVDSTDPSITNAVPETVQVGLYVTASTPAAEINVPVLETGRDVTGLVADPIRPYVYATNGLTDIFVFNVYTGALVDTISVAGTSLRFMTVSTEGSRLYVMDHANVDIVTVDLGNLPLTANAPWTGRPWLCGSCSSTRSEIDLHYTRINGQEVLVASGREIIDAETGAPLFGPSNGVLFSSTPLGITDSGGVLFENSVSFFRYALKYSYLNGTFDIVQSHQGAGVPYDITSDPAGDRIFGGCNAEAGELTIVSGQDLSILSTHSINGATSSKYGPDGLVYCAGYSPVSVNPNAAVDVWAIDPDTRVINREFRVPGRVAERRFVFSGDGLRLITRSDDQSVLSFLTTQ